MTTTPSARRIGSTDSTTRTQLVDAAEALLLEAGYAAVTSRRVAAQAELKPQLVHYYFRTMDDLFLEVFRRRADQNLARLEHVIATDGSLRGLWDFASDPRGATFTVEFAALAHHRPAVRDELARYAELFRTVQLKAISAALGAAHVPDEQMPPMVALLLMTGLSQVLGIEQTLGVTSGHRATVDFIRGVVAQLEAG